MNYRKQINVILTVFVTLFAFATALSADGDLDLSFNGTGKVTTHVGDQPDDANNSAVQSDGKIVVVGNSGSDSSEGFAIARYNIDGSLDHTFDNDGRVLTQFGIFDYVYSVAIQSDDKIVIAGYTRVEHDLPSEMVVVRYNRNGSLDTSFDGDGIAEVQIGSCGANSIAIQADGKIVAVGSSSQNLGGGNYTVDTLIVRFNSDGSLDTDFGIDGVVTNPTAIYLETIYTVAIQPDGKILTRSDKYITRYNANGSIDTLFGNSGKISVVNSRNLFLSDSLKVQTDGKILALGNANYEWLVFRFNSDGSADISFGNAGVVIIGTTYTYASMTLLTDGKILIVEDFSNERDIAILKLNNDGTKDLSFGVDGVVLNLSPYPYEVSGVSINMSPDNKILVTSRLNRNYLIRDFIVNSYNADGSKNTSFGQDGKVTTGGFIGNCTLNAMVAQSDGKIVAVGYVHSSTSLHYDFAVVRYNKDGSLDGSFGEDGKVSTIVTEFNNNRYSVANSVAIQEDGKIVVVGTTIGANLGYNSVFAIVRYNPDGSLDTSFDGDGKILAGIRGQNRSEPTSVLIQPDGKIVVAGKTLGVTYNQAIIRYNSNGELDKTFGENGVVFETAWKIFDIVALGIDLDGKLVTLGTSDPFTNKNGFAIARYNSDGTTDNSFGVQGKVITSFESIVRVKSLKIQADGKIIAGGTSKNGTPDSETIENNKNVFTVLRYNTDGSLDNTFDGDGKAFAIFETDANLNCLAIQTDGKIVATGNLLKLYSPSVFATVRFNTNGGLDITFDNDGKVETQFYNKYAVANSVVIQPNGGIVVGGDLVTSIGLVRYQGTAVAQNAEISGRITTASSRGIANVSVQISGGNLGESKYTMTNSFGYYRFKDLAVGQTYVVGVSAKRYSFANPTRIINLKGNLLDEDFISDSK